MHTLTLHTHTHYIAYTLASDHQQRTWKTFYVALRGHILYFYAGKDSMAGMAQFKPAGGRVSVSASLCDIAYDYKKRRHVFRLQVSIHAWIVLCPPLSVPLFMLLFLSSHLFACSWRRRTAEVSI